MKSFNDLYLDYENEQLEVKMALESVIRDERVVNEAAKQYQLGKAQDLIYAEQQLAKGAAFNTVKKTITSNIKKRTGARPEFDGKLRKALLKSKKLPDTVYQYQAHHIVAKGARRARQAISILRALGIDIDDPANGVFLPASDTDKKYGARPKAYIHNTIHTNVYYANVTFEVVRMFRRTANKSQNERKADMVKLLDRIGNDLAKGQYSLYQLIPGAEQFDL